MLGLIDESTPAGPRGVHYVITSAVVLNEDRDACRKRVVGVLDGRAGPFHWSSEGVHKRTAMIATFGENCVAVFTVIHHPIRANLQAKARSAALTTLLGQMVQDGVEEVWIESRGSQDRHDRQTIIDAMHGLPENLSYDFRDKTEPLLWLPDAAAGAFSEDEMGKEKSYALALQNTVGQVRVVHL